MPDKDHDDVAKHEVRAPKSKAIRINWGEVERTILKASASVLLLLYCLELVGHKLQSIVRFITGATH